MTPKLVELMCARILSVAMAFLVISSQPVATQAETTLRVVMNSDLKILDPVWTSAYITRNHGYMIYDTLFATDDMGEIKPQMLDKYELSSDMLTYTFTLRDGLIWHDGQPVTSEDCVASIRRWAAKDASGQMLMTFIESLDAVDSKTFRLKLKEPTGLVLSSLGKRSSLVPFMMPKRVADTAPDKQISNFTGSGPFVFKKEEWKPGYVAVYVRFDKYKPRSEPASAFAGGKIAKVDRVEWRAISDHNQAVNALLAGEIDYIEAPPHDLHPILIADPNVKLRSWNPFGMQYILRPNHLHKPFDNPKVRRALWLALNQEDFLKAGIGNPGYYKPCKALFGCGTALASEKGMDGLLASNFEKAKALLKEAGYDGTPVVLMHQTDLHTSANLAPVAKSLMEKGGFKVDMQSMDWQTLVSRRAKKASPVEGGWHAFLTANATIDITDPVIAQWLNASCDKALPGWPCDPEIEKLRFQYARATDPTKRKATAEAIQVRVTEWTTHIHLGEWSVPAAIRKNISGILSPGVPVFWNIEKN
jgi:peptide/nickel transport system substrate-binding protein